MARRLPARGASGRFLKRRRAGGRRRRRRNAYLATVNPRRRRRRNPPAILTARGIMGAAQDAAVGGAGVVVGEIGARQGITLLRLDPSQPLGIAGQFAVALGLGMLARQFRIGGTFGKAVVYGAAAGGVRSVLRLLAPDVAGRLLAGDDGYEVPLGAYEDQRALPPGQGVETMMGMYTTGVM